MNENSLTGEGQSILGVEDEYIEAEILKDKLALQRMLDDRFVFNSKDGKTMGKSDLIEYNLNWNLTGQTLSERSVMVDGNTGLVFGTTELQLGQGGGEETASHLRYTAV